jgi:serine-type D-Ala-D-Ala carboxypeptidase
MEIESTPRPAAQGIKRTRFAAVYRILTDAIACRAFPGCAFGVLAAGSSDFEVVLQDALGRFTYDENSPTVTAGTIFDVASITKVAATTATVMLLNQRGHLDLDMLLGQLLPGFVAGRAPGDRAHKVTLRHLLAHSSGLPAHVEFYRTLSTPAALYRACLELPLEAEPGTRAVYSDMGFILLGMALEVMVREPLDQFVGREIFEPLSMASTGFCPPLSAAQLIPPTEEDTTLRHRRIQGEVQDENAWLLKGVAGHAGLFSNVPDLLRFAREILDGVRRPASGVPQPFLFQSDTIERFAMRQDPPGSSRALGWDTPSENSSAGSKFSPHSIGHLGYSGCSLWIDLKAGIAVVLLTNRTWPDRTSQLIREVRPSFHDAVRQGIVAVK